MLDNNNPRNAITQESHGFITQDGIKPKEFREIAHKEIGRYPSVRYAKREVTSIIKNNNYEPSFELDYYGKSLFHCPYCDGYELRDKPLIVIIGEQIQGFHFIQTIYNWSKDLVVCTNNGEAFQNSAQKSLLQNKGIKIIESKIKNFVGENGQIEKIIFENGQSVLREGGLSCLN